MLILTLNTCENKGGKNMSFVKGVVIGSILTAGTMMMYSEGLDENKKKMMKKGKQIVRKMKMSM